jgi:hypothetical protein
LGITVPNGGSWIYNGSRWTARPMVSLSPEFYQQVTAVSCVKSVCTAVGFSLQGTMAQRLG